MHVHVSALAALIVFAYVLIIGFIWRWLAAQYSEYPIGKAMSTLF